MKTLHETHEKTETEHKEQVEAVHEAVQQQLNEQEEALQQQLKEKVRTTLCEITKVYCNPHCRRRNYRHWQPPPQRTRQLPTHSLQRFRV